METREAQMWGSHLPALMCALLATDGHVLEVGCGYWSTPILRSFCEAAKRYFLSVDDSIAWMDKIRGGKLQHVNYDIALPVLAKDRKWSVVFLDHSPGPRRATDALLFRDSAEIIVVHDYGGENVEAFAPVLKEWLYGFDLVAFNPHTLVLTNHGHLVPIIVGDR